MTSSVRRKKQDLVTVAEIRGTSVEAMMQQGRKSIYKVLESFNRADDIEFTYGQATVDEFTLEGAAGLWKMDVTGVLHDVEIIEPSPFEMLQLGK
jgi:hypothetical protein